MDIIGLVIDVAELGLDLVLGKPKKPSRRWEIALLCFLLGGVAALLSVRIWPMLLIREPSGQAAWLLAAPVAAGLLAGFAAGVRRDGGPPFSRFHFTCAMLFMLALGLARRVFCN